LLKLSSRWVGANSGLSTRKGIILMDSVVALIIISLTMVLVVQATKVHGIRQRKFEAEEIKLRKEAATVSTKWKNLHVKK